MHFVFFFFVVVNSGPCGDKGEDEHIRYFIQEDTTWYFVMIKNLQHYSESMPGNFTINLLDNDANFISTIGSTPDTADPEGTVYQVKAKTPSGLDSGDGYIIQVKYINFFWNVLFFRCAVHVILAQFFHFFYFVKTFFCVLFCCVSCSFFCFFFLFFHHINMQLLLNE